LRASFVPPIPRAKILPFEAAMAGIHEKAQRDGAAAQLIQRIRKVG
jgi:hypothetical protein